MRLFDIMFFQRLEFLEVYVAQTAIIGIALEGPRFRMFGGWGRSLRL